MRSGTRLGERAPTGMTTKPPYEFAGLPDSFKQSLQTGYVRRHSLEVCEKWAVCEDRTPSLLGGNYEEIGEHADFNCCFEIGIDPQWSRLEFTTHAHAIDCPAHVFTLHARRLVRKPGR